MDRSPNVIRILVKAAAVFIALNLMYALFDPQIGRWNGYNTLWPGRPRFPYAGTPGYYQLSYNTPVFEDFDAMFGTHMISSTPKGDHEFRVLLLGDSATWGGHVGPNEMLAAQLNQLDLMACGKQIRAYDLGYPWPSLIRDILILDWAKRYDPDLIVWSVTLHGFEKNIEDRDFLIPHADQLAYLADTYNIDLPKMYLGLPRQTFWDKTIIGQRKHIKSVILNQTYGPMWAATGVDNYYAFYSDTLPTDMPASVSYQNYKSALQAPELIRSLLFDVLRAGHDIAGTVPMIVINEPIYINSGRNSDLRYNELYSRWAYDAYRAYLADWIKSKDYIFYDYWNALPPDEFHNAMFHRGPQGERRFANIIAPNILETFATSCR